MTDNVKKLCGEVALWFAVLSCPVSHQAIAADSKVENRLASATREATSNSFREWISLLSIPNDSVNANDIKKNAEWLRAAFEKRGFETRTLPNREKPLVFAELKSGVPDAKTVMFYMHFDGQPVVPSQWSQASPWVPVLKRKDASGQWQEIDIQELFGEKLDNDWRVFSRSAADDKAPITMLLAAFDSLKGAGAAPQYNLKVLLDSEEEKGSPSLGTVISSNAALLRSDAVVVLDGPLHPSNRPTIVLGNRGVLRLQIKVFGPKQDAHSGHYGNYARNPAQGLALILGSMKDRDGKVTIRRFYDPVKLDAKSRRVMAAVPDDEAALRRRLGIAAAEKIGANYQEAMQYPTLNIRGLASGFSGEKARTIIPAEATADIDVRTVPETSPDYLFGLIKQHVSDLGYHLVNGAPTDAERQQYEYLAAVTKGQISASSTAVRTELDAAVTEWARRAFSRTYAGEPVTIRMMGGTVPTGALVQALRVPFVIVPLVNADNNQHSFDENMRIGNYVDGVERLVGILETPLP